MGTSLRNPEPTESSAEDKCNELEEAWNSCMETAEILKEEVAEVPYRGDLLQPPRFLTEADTMISKKGLCTITYSF